LFDNKVAFVPVLEIVSFRSAPEQFNGNDILNDSPAIFRKSTSQGGETGIGQIRLFRIHDSFARRKGKLFVGNDEKRLREVMEIISNRAFTAGQIIAFQLLFESGDGKYARIVFQDVVHQGIKNILAHQDVYQITISERSKEPSAVHHKTRLRLCEISKEFAIQTC
jgi:hypothetical protein